MSKEFAPRHLDVKHFAHLAGELSGRAPVKQFPRLLAESQSRGADLEVAWKARGEARKAVGMPEQIWLHIDASAKMALTCQRCLHPVEVDVGSVRSFRFVPDEATAAAEDEEAEEDVLVISRSLDLLDLVEDELLMEMPPVPRHEVCPVPVKLAVADEDFHEEGEAKTNPFAVLARLPKDKPS